MDNGVCRGCDPNCHSCTDRVCNRCKAGLILDDRNQCVQTCETYQFPDFSSIIDGHVIAVCADCPVAEGCATCTAVDLCLTCSKGYHLLADKSCEKCGIKNCDNCEGGRCIECKPGLYIDHEGQCVKNCPGTYFKSDTHTCEKCSAGCAMCEAATACDDCQRGY